MKARILHLAIVLALLCSGAAFAQEDGGSTMNIGSYLFSGSLSAGLRATDISTFDDRLTNSTVAENLFYEQYNLRKGLKAFGLNLYGERAVGGQGLFDQLFLNASSSGPFTVGSLRVRNVGKFDLKVDYKSSDYFFKRFDSLFSGVRPYDFNRTRFNAGLTVTPTEDIDVALNYYSVSREGEQTNPRSLFYEVPSSFSQFGGAGRANFYHITTPRTDRTNDVSAKVTVRVPMTSITVGAGNRSFKEDLIGTALSNTSLTFLPAPNTPNEFGIIGNNPNKEFLNDYRWDDKRDNSANYFFGEVVFKPIDQLSATAYVNMDNGTGDGTIDAVQGGVARLVSNGSVTTLYRGSVEGTTSFDDKHLNTGINVAYRPISELAIVAGFQMKNLDRTVDGEYHITLDTATRAITPPVYSKAGLDSLQHLETETTYKIPETIIMGDVSFAPMPELNVSAGIRMSSSKPEVRFSEDGVQDSAVNADLSRETQFMTISGNLYYKPIDELALRARVTSKTGKAYAEGTTTEVDMAPRRTPKEDFGISGSVDVEPMEGLSLSVGVGTNSGKSALLNMRPTVINPEIEHKGKNLNGSITYTTSDLGIGPMTFMFCGDYQQSDFSIPSTFARGTLVGIPPLGDSSTVLITENTIDRFIGASLSLNPISALEIMVGYDMTRSTGGSQMTQSVVTPDSDGDVEKVSAPYTLSSLRGHVQYDFVRQAGVAVDLMMVSMKEDPEGFNVALNNYKATVLTFSLIVKL